jgi:pimeloyl-ACP methyl ester carboxylesterase
MNPGTRRRLADRRAAANLRQRTHQIEVDGTRIAWTERGQGEDLVLLHGIGDSRRTWRCVAPVLATRYRVLMPDLPGHGMSGRPDAPYTLTWFAAVISDWMAAIGVRHAHLVGHSFGGGVAQWLVLDHRTRVDRLALIAAGGLGPEVGLGLRLAALPFTELLYSPAAMWFGTLLSLLLSPDSFGNPTLPEIGRRARENGIRGTGRAFSRTIRGVVNVFGQVVQTREGVGAVTSLPPVALYWGADDPVIPVKHGRLALGLFPGATLEVFPGCGHYPHLQQPEKVAAKVLEFLGDPQRAPVRLDPAARAAIALIPAVAEILPALERGGHGSAG